MRSTITAFILLAAIIVLLIANAVILNGCGKKLISMADELGDEPTAASEAAEELVKYWRKIQPFVSISVTHTEAESVCTAAELIAAYAKVGDNSEFTAAKRIFKDAVRHIIFSGECSFESIL